MSVEENNIGSEYAYDRAARENLEVVLPKKNQLFIDIDSDKAMKVFQENWSVFIRFYSPISPYRIAPSKSGGKKKHIVIDLASPVDQKERLLLQAFLGSDLKREFFGLLRVKMKDKHPTLFLEKKNEGKKQ